MRRLCFLLVLTTGPVAAHDFWVQPQAFQVSVAAPAPFTIQVGHGTFRQRWGAAIDRIKRFDEVGPKGSRNLLSVLMPPGGPSDGAISFAEPGTHVILLETNHARSELPSIRFNDYLKVEGLTPALAFRDRSRSAGSPGREQYSRRAKALVQVGTPGSAGDGKDEPQVTRPVGLTLEIVPQRNPYSLAPTDDLPVLILYEGRPLAGATVKLNNLDFDARPIETRLSDARGMASFHPPRQGKWQLNVVWTKPLVGNPTADFDTVFSSLTFGFGKPVR